MLEDLVPDWKCIRDGEKGGSWLMLCRRGLALAGLDVDLGARGRG